MKFEQIKPPEHLKNHVRYFWKLEDDSDNLSPQTFRIMSDGCPGIIFHRPENGVLYQNSKEMPSVCLYGQSTEYAKLKSKGRFSAIGVFLFPNTLRTIFGLNAKELTNTCLDLDLFSKKKESSISQNLGELDSAEKQISTLSSYIFSQIQQNKAPNDRKINYAISEINNSNGHISLKHLQEYLELSERSLQRKFNRYVGITPKIYSRICQFQASLHQLRQSNYKTLSDVAYDNEYSDQSHFIRSFRQFAGFSPKQFQKQSGEVVENLTPIEKQQK